MRDLVELYEMISANDAALRDTEAMAMINAGRALNMFERAMISFMQASTERQVGAGAALANAA